MKSILDDLVVELKFKVGTKFRWKSDFAEYEIIGEPEFGMFIPSGLSKECYSFKANIKAVRSKSVFNDWVCDLSRVEVL
jgi:hypothetical protein